MKKIIYVFATFAALCLSSCGNEMSEIYPNGEKATLKVKTDIVATKATISSFPANSLLGMFITNGSLGSNYEGQSTNVNVKATGTGSSWALAPAVYLTNKPATIFAYYPYNSAVTDGTAIPVTNDQTDYMYGTNSDNTVVNNDNATALLTMNHSLSLVELNLSKTNYPGAGVVSKVEIANANGKTFLFNAGKLNVVTGDITGTVGQNNSTITSPSVSIPATTSVMVLPTVATAAVGDLVFNLTIDGKIYSCPVPAATKWVDGTKNSYSINLSGKGLVISTIIISPWITGVNVSGLQI